MPISSSPWFVQSASECTASASIDPEPVNSAATSLLPKIAKFAHSAIRIVLRESALPVMASSVTLGNATPHRVGGSVFGCSEPEHPCSMLPAGCQQADSTIAPATSHG